MRGDTSSVDEDCSEALVQAALAELRLLDDTTPIKIYIYLKSMLQLARTVQKIGPGFDSLPCHSRWWTPALCKSNFFAAWDQYS